MYTFNNNNAAVFVLGCLNLCVMRQQHCYPMVFLLNFLILLMFSMALK